MGQKLDTMRQQRSQAALVYEMVNRGNVEAIEVLHREGASLEWADEDGKTPLILACMEPRLLPIARILIELGANVHTYRPGCRGGTPLHHAAGKGLKQTVKLLLSQRANVLVRNDDNQTPLDVARLERHTGIVRAIENHICYFSGWLREFYGPSLLEALTPQLLSRKVWVVVIPYGSSSRKEPSKLELVIYPTWQDSQPRTVIDLWKSKVEEPTFDRWNPKLTIFHQSTSCKYKFASAEEGDIQQLRYLYRACRGIPQAAPPAVLPNTQTSSSIDTSQTAAETINTNGWGVSDNNSSHKGWGPSLQTEAIYTNGWEISDDSSTHTGWGSTRPCKHSEINSNGWMDRPAKDDYNGWGILDYKPHDSSEAIRITGWGSSNERSNHNGWGQSIGREGSEVNCNGWLEKPAKDDYNGWGVLDSKPVDQMIQHVQSQNNDSHVVSQDSYSAASVHTKPSAPPIPDDDMSDGQILYPSIDFSAPAPAMVEASVTNGINNGNGGGGGESSCVICWEAPIEGACVPCGHMAGCTSCLNGVKAKRGVCPICRTKLDQVVKLYVV